ncbi:MAG: exopolysaccharide biosynthesis protein [Actinophytocola sp.]|nr:exopolysaccharide biosynthesis protein [Actinophytocola sp.]
MNDEVVRLAMIGQIIRRRWPSLVAIAIVGALAGAGASLLLSPGYQTTTQLLLGGPQEDNERSAQAQLAMSATVLDRTAAKLDWKVTGYDLRDAVNAEVVEGGLIEITGAADTPRRAQRLTDRVATEYATFAGELLFETNDAPAQLRLQRLDDLRKKIEVTNEQIDQIHRSANKGDLTVDTVQVRTQLETLRNSLDGAVAQLDLIEAAPTRQRPVVIGPALLPSGKASPTPSQLAGAGAVAFLIAGIFAHIMVVRSDTRLRAASEIAAALGAPVIGTVPVLDEQDVPTLWLRLRPRRKRDAETLQQPMPGGDMPGDPHYRRALARLRAASGPDLRLLVIATNDDRLAHRAVARLAVAAGKESGHPTVLRVSHISHSDPVLPDHGDIPGALLVLGAGKRTAWELVGIAGACADAGYVFVGAVVAQQSAVTAAQPAPAILVDPAVTEPAANATNPVLGAENDDTMAGRP